MATGLIFLLQSCAADSPSIVTIQNASVVDVSLPDTLVFQQTEVFEVSYIEPTTCHDFENFVVQGSGQNLTIRTQTRFEENFECEDINAIETAQFEFFVESQEDYTFRFLAGVSDSSLEYITVEVPVKVE